jgi:hypothetical protein
MAVGTRLEGSEVVVRNEDGLLTATVDDELIGMSIDQGVCYGLNAVGTRVWELIAAPRSIDSLCEELLSEFDVEGTECRRQVIELLEELHTEGLVAVQAG